MPNPYDVLTLLGIGMVGAGLYFIYPPLALIVPGALLLLLGLVAGRGRASAQNGDVKRRLDREVGRGS